LIYFNSKFKKNQVINKKIFINLLLLFFSERIAKLW